MTTTLVRGPADRPYNPAADPSPAQATGLLGTLAGLPPRDPTRRAARTAAIEAWQPLADRLARRYMRRGEPLDDLTQVAAIGLIKAVDRFDAGRGAPFAAFAVPTIVGEIKRHFRDRTWTVRIPRYLQELCLSIGVATDSLTQTLGRTPSVADIAGHLGISEDAVLEAMEGARAYRATSLSRRVGDGDGVELADTIEVTEPGYETTEVHLALQPAIAALDERDRRIITLRFYGNRTQTQIAGELGMSQMHVSRLLARALGRMQESIVGGREQSAPVVTVVRPSRGL